MVVGHVLTPAGERAKGAKRTLILMLALLLVLAGGARCASAASSSGGGSGDGGVPEAATANNPGAGGGGMVIAAAGDIACPSCKQGRTADLLAGLLASEGLVAILPLGDNAYPDGALADYRASYAPSWGQPSLLAITHPVPGNHDYATGGKDGAGYFDFFDGAGNAAGVAGARDQGFYSYDLGNWHIIALNSSNSCDPVACGPGSSQLAWLEADLAGSHASCTLAYLHHPRFQQGTVRGDTPAIAPLWDALYDAGADVVVSAHEHNYQQFAPMDKDGALDRARGLRSFVVGTGGTTDYYDSFDTTRHADAFETRAASVTGVLELTLRDGGYDWRFITVDGVVPPGASGSGTCH
jgi:hypothetical protein